MTPTEKKSETVDDYIANFPEEVRIKLQEIRKIIRENAPDAKEVISWGMPTYKLNGNLVHFAAAKHHIGLYPGAEAIEVFSEELKDFQTSKGTIRLPLNKPLPEKLITKIVLFRVTKSRISQ